MRRTGRILTRAWWTTVLLVTPPLALLRLLGPPLPAQWPTADLAGTQATQRAILAAATLTGWLLWITVLAVAAARAGRAAGRLARRLRHIRPPRPVQSLSAVVLGSVAATTAANATPAAAHATTSTTPHLNLDPPRPAHTDLTGLRPADAPRPGPVMVRPADRRPTYTVHRGDTLWRIAATRLGDPRRWPQIYQLNRSRFDQHGRMHHGHHIEPGWILLLPDDARRPAGAQPAPPPPHTGASATPPATSPSPPAASPSATAAPSATPTTAPTGTPDDTVIIPAPTNSPAPSQPASAQPPPTPAAATSPTPAPPGPAAHHNGGHHRDPGVELPGGGWVTAPLAAAVAAAAALVWIQRRRRYRPRPPAGRDRDDADLTPLPRTVAALHQARPLPTFDNHAKDEHVDHITDDRQHLEPQARKATTITAVSFGVHANRQLRLPDLPPLGVGLTGPGAHAAARGVLAAVLSAGGPWAPGDEATITTTTTDLETLLGPDAPDRYPFERLHVADSINDALAHLERQLLRRARLATDHHSSDLTTLHPDNPDQPPPPIVFLATTPEGPSATALAAILAVGSRLAIAGLLLGPWSTGTTWHVNTDGTTRSDTNPDAAGPRLNVLDTTAAADILDTLRQAHPASNDLPPPPRPQRQTAPILHTAATKPTTPTTPAEPPSVDPDHIPQPPAAQPARTDGQPPAEQGSTPAGDGPRLRLSVLGKPALHLVTGDTTTQVRIRRSHAVQILVHLAVAPEGATSDELMAALWPETRPHFSRGRFHTNISELRDVLAEAAGTEAITRTDERYRLDPAHLDVDIWQLTAAARRAATTIEPTHHADALHEVIKLHTGPVADGHNWLWLAPYREAIRRHVLDAYTGLADTETDPATALALIQEAIRLDPYNEDVYQRAMRLHTTLNSADGVTRTLRTLTERLAELEIDASPQTQQIATDLLAKLQARRRNHGNAA